MGRTSKNKFKGLPGDLNEDEVNKSSVDGSVLDTDDENASQTSKKSKKKNKKNVGTDVIKSVADSRKGTNTDITASQNMHQDMIQLRSKVKLSDKVEDHKKSKFKCKVCKKVVDENCKALICKGRCCQWHHIECVGITELQFNMINDLGGLIHWICETDLLIFKKCNKLASCSHSDDNVVNKEDIKNSEMKILCEIKKLQQKVNIIETSCDSSSKVNLNPSVSYSTVLKSMPKKDLLFKKPKLQGIIIKPKKMQCANTTVSDVKSKINPAEIKVGIESVTPLSNGLVIVRASTEPENLRFVEEAKIKLADLYDVTRTKIRRPRLFLSSLEKKYEESELLSELAKVNHFISLDDDINVIYMKQHKKTKNWMTSLEVSAEVFKKLVNRYINLGWRSYFIKEDTHISRCFNCQGYNHNANNCNNARACLKCAGPHSINECKSSEIKCRNCHSSNIKFKTEFSIDHQSNDQNCNTYLAKLNKLRFITAYSTVQPCQ